MPVFEVHGICAYKRLKLVELQHECNDRSIRYRGCNKKRLIELLRDFDEAVAQNDAATADGVNSEQVSDVESNGDDNEVAFGRPASRQSYTAAAPAAGRDRPTAGVGSDSSSEEDEALRLKLLIA